MKELSDYDIIKYCQQHHIKLNHIYSRDQLPKVLPIGFYIFNLNKADQSGSHWTASSISPNGNFYCDSFGFMAFQELEDRIKPYYYNTKVLQDERSSSCGWWCMMFLKFIQENGNSKHSFKEFLSLFTDKPTMNEHILENWFENLH